MMELLGIEILLIVVALLTAALVMFVEHNSYRLSWRSLIRHRTSSVPLSTQAIDEIFDQARDNMRRVTGKTVNEFEL